MFNQCDAIHTGICQAVVAMCGSSLLGGFNFLGVKQGIIWPAHHSEPQQDEDCPGIQFKHSARDIWVLQKKNYMEQHKASTCAQWLVKVTGFFF